jgi:hypothetical protein
MAALLIKVNFPGVHTQHQIALACPRHNHIDY